jgi:hypothetical protein
MALWHIRQGAVDFKFTYCFCGGPHAIAPEAAGRLPLPLTETPPPWGRWFSFPGPVCPVIVKRLGIEMCRGTRWA